MTRSAPFFSASISGCLFSVIFKMFTSSRSFWGFILAPILHTIFAAGFRSDLMKIPFDFWKREFSKTILYYSKTMVFAKPLNLNNLSEYYISCHVGFVF